MEEKVAPAPPEEQETDSPEPEKPSKDLLDRTWDFFASVPVATVIIFIIAVASVAGTLIEQEGQYSDWRPPAEFFPARYGPALGNFLFKTGLTRMYTQWWYMGLLFMLGASLLICSLERFVPLWRAVQRPNIAPPAAFVKHLKNRFEYKPAKDGNPLAPLMEALKARRYFVVQAGDSLYADKGRWGRWGPYVTHVGLFLILAGAMLRAIPGFYSDQSIWVQDGASVRVPGTDWFVQSERFELETYEDFSPKAYKTHAIVIDGGKEVKKHTISMNQPLWYKWVELYQSSYKQELGAAEVALKDRATGKQIGTFEINLLQPEPSYAVMGYKIVIKEYYPDFGLDQGGKPTTRSGEVQNPGLRMEVTDPDGKTFTTWYFVLYPEMEFDTKTPVKFNTLERRVASTTGLRLKKDLGIPVIYLGLIIVSIGVFATFYITHRRFWALVDGRRVVVGGWTNRNLGTFKSEVAALGTLLDPKTNPHVDPLEGEER